MSGLKVKDNLHTDLHTQEEEIAASKCCCSSNYFEYLDVYGEKEEFFNSQDKTFSNTSSVLSVIKTGPPTELAA